MSISMENLINSFKLRRTRQEMRRHGGYIAHGNLQEFDSTQQYNYIQIAYVDAFLRSRAEFLL